MSLTINGNVLIEGVAAGPALVLDDALSFWGGFDPTRGQIIDVHHPQYGVLVGGSILFIPQSRGSAGTPAGIAETLRNGTGPLAIVLAKRDVNIAVGVQIANQLYEMKVPVIEIALEQMQLVSSGAVIAIDSRGVISVG